MPAALSDLLNNDLRNVAQQFVTTHYYCRVLEKKIEERNCQGYQDRVGGRGSQEAELNNLRKKLQQSQDRVSKLERDLHDIQEGYANTDKRRKAEIEKKTEKITNQKRRIKEQQDQIDVGSNSHAELTLNGADLFALTEPEEEVQWQQGPADAQGQQGL